MDKAKVAIVQKPPIYLNLNLSIEKAIEYIKEASQNFAKIIVFPETWLPGYPVWLDYSPNAALWDHKPANELYKILADNSIKIESKQFEALLSAAKEFSVCVVMGANELVGRTIYNSIIYINENGEFKVHRKLIPTYTERLVWGRGDGSTINVMETEYGVIGGLICWEHWMPLLRAAMHSKNETIHVAQWPMVKEMNIIASRHYAFEGQCFVIAAGVVITKQEMLDGLNSLELNNSEAKQILEEIPCGNNELVMKGGSCVISPKGDFITEPLYKESKLIYADIEPNKVIEGGIVIDTDGHYSRPDVFHLEVNTKSQTNVTFSDKV